MLGKNCAVDIQNLSLAEAKRKFLGYIAPLVYRIFTKNDEWASLDLVGSRYLLSFSKESIQDSFHLYYFLDKENPEKKQREMLYSENLSKQLKSNPLDTLDAYVGKIKGVCVYPKTEWVVEIPLLAAGPQKLDVFVNRMDIHIRADISLSDLTQNCSDEKE